MDLAREIDRLQRELRSLAGKGQGKWLLRGSFLCHARVHHAWDTRGSNTMVHFIRSLSDQLGVKEALLWREMKAYNYYRKLRDRYPAVPDEPSLLEFADKGYRIPGSGHLDALERLEQVFKQGAAPDEFKDIVSGVFRFSKDETAYTQAYLEGRWRVLRGALNESSERDSARLNESLMLDRLMRSQGRWRERSSDQEYSDFLDLVRCEIFTEVNTGNGRLDAIAVVVHESRETRPVLHGIEVCGNPERLGDHKRLRAKLFKFLPAVDFLWIAFPGPSELPEFIKGDEFAGIGILQIDRDGIWVERPAKPEELKLSGGALPPGHDTAEVAKCLLALKVNKRG